MKKQTKKTIAIIVALTFLFILVANQMGYLSFVSGASEMRCSNSGIDTFSCNLVGSGEVEYSGEKIKLTMTEPSWGEFCGKLEALSDGTCSGCPNNKACLAGRVYAYMKEQFIIMEGTWEKEISPGVSPETGAFKTYGICSLETCWVYDPFPDESVALRTTSIIIYFKDGGYVESDACLEFNVCPKISVYRFENNECNLITISENLRTFNDYDTLAECESKIVIPSQKINVYRLENNICTFMNILKTEKTELDFDTLEECEENITVPPTTNITIIIIIILIIIGGLIGIYYYLRKR